MKKPALHRLHALGFVRKYDRQYPAYELVEYNNISEVLVHQQDEGNDFCLLDDKIVMQKLKVFLRKKP